MNSILVQMTFYQEYFTCDKGFLFDVVGVGSSTLTPLKFIELTSDSSSDKTLVFVISSASNFILFGTNCNLNTPPCSFSVSNQGFKPNQSSDHGHVTNQNV